MRAGFFPELPSKKNKTNRKPLEIQNPTSGTCCLSSSYLSQPFWGAMTLSVVSFASAPFFCTFLRLYFLVSIMRTHSLLFHMQTCTFSRVDAPFASSFAHPHPFRTRPFPTTLFSSCRNFHSALTNISPFALPDGSWSYPLPPWSQSSRDSVEHQRLRKQQQQIGRAHV